MFTNSTSLHSTIQGLELWLIEPSLLSTPFIPRKGDLVQTHSGQIGKKMTTPDGEPGPPTDRPGRQGPLNLIELNDLYPLSTTGGGRRTGLLIGQVWACLAGTFRREARQNRALCFLRPPGSPRRARVKGSAKSKPWAGRHPTRAEPSIKLSSGEELAPLADRQSHGADAEQQQRRRLGDNGVAADGLPDRIHQPYA